MELYLLAVAVLLPIFSAVLCYMIRRKTARNIIIVATALIMFAVAGRFVGLLLDNGGRISIQLGETLDFAAEIIIKILDLFLFLYFISIGVKQKKPLIIILTLLQLIPVVLFELFGDVKVPEVAFVIDYLSLIMILLVSIIGPIITIFAMGYMKEHEHHLNLKKSRQPRFFFILFLFLGAMNALVMTNNLMWMYFFWEITTLCSYLLISHDGTELALKNGIRALWINLLGGIGFIAGIIVIYKAKNTISIEDLAHIQSASDLTTLLPLGLGLICFAGFTKSAQFPFQSWLLGAMVAPTPVSALLHSSTMVKAGVYIIVRFAPAYSNTTLGKVIAIAGGFSFLAGSAIAISQRNGKRVLAYSTIANLGLIVCCAGIGNPIAIGAAILLMVFHAVSKGLLFMCMGTIEQGIGSRDIEDMQGLMKRMPFTTVITVIGMISMLLPPFGVMITKWLSIEAAVDKSPVVLILLILGSALTVVFWAKWIGIILTMSFKPNYKKENLLFSVKSSLTLLFIAVLGCTMGVSQLYTKLVEPHIESLGIMGGAYLSGKDGGLWSSFGIFGGTVGGFSILYFFILVFALMLTVPIFLRKARPESIKPPYLCGENTNDIRGIEFVSVADKKENVIVRNYYLSGAFGEDKLTVWCNAIAGALILIMFGVII